jgi:hypothetical protein
MMTNFEYEQGVSEMLNSVSPNARKAIESDLVYMQSKQDNDWVTAYQFVYGWLNGTAKNKSELRRKLKKKTG